MTQPTRPRESTLALDPDVDRRAGRDDAGPGRLGQRRRADRHGPRVERQRDQRDPEPEHPAAAAGAASPPGLGQVPPLAPVNLAIVHAAIYDAVNAIDGTHEPYLLDIHAPPDASQAAAVATAAHHVLVGLVPTTLPQVTASLDALYATSLGKITDGKAKSDGIVVGAAAAAVMLADRLDDGRNGTRMFDVGTDPGEWRPVPPLSNNVFSWVGEIRPFSLKRPDQIRIPAPPPLKSNATRGSSTRSRRSAPRRARLGRPSSRPWRTGSS